MEPYTCAFFVINLLIFFFLGERFLSGRGGYSPPPGYATQEKGNNWKINQSISIDNLFTLNQLLMYVHTGIYYEYTVIVVGSPESGLVGYRDSYDVCSLKSYTESMNLYTKHPKVIWISYTNNNDWDNEAKDVLHSSKVLFIRREAKSCHLTSPNPL